MARHKNKKSNCANCGFNFAGADNFCPDCGQENHDIRLPLRHHLAEILEGLFHFDSKTYKSVKTLLLHPGRLSLDYNQGKRVPYVAPLRFYIFISFLFFLVLALKPFYTDTQHAGTDLTMKFLSDDEAISEAERSGLSPTQLDSLKRFRSELSIDELRGLSDAQIEALMQAKGMSGHWLNRYVVHKFSKIARGEEEKFWHSILKTISYSMFVLMPVFALVLMLFYRRQNRYYVESLVLSIHYHTFLFIVLTVLVFAGKILPAISGYGILLAFAFFPIYLLLMLRKYFKQKIVLTLAKVVVIDLIHLILIVLTFMASVVISMMLI